MTIKTLLFLILSILLPKNKQIVWNYPKVINSPQEKTYILFSITVCKTQAAFDKKTEHSL